MEIISETYRPAEQDITPIADNKPSDISQIDLSNIPAYSGDTYIAINNNIPYFTESDLTTTSFEKYSSLDNLGRCRVAYANIGTDLMPTEERG